MLGWFQALMPKEERFFELFARHATIVVAGAEALRGLLQGGDSIERYCKQIFEREAEADEITRQVLTAVRRTFVTPFDRTDIQDLITSMDDAIDQMNKTAKIITLFEVRSFEPQMQQMGEIIVQAANLVLEAVPLLSSIGTNAGRLNTLTAKIIADRGAGRRNLRSGPQGAIPRQSPATASRARQCDELHHRVRALRSSGEGRRPFRGCLERDKFHRHRSSLTSASRDDRPPEPARPDRPHRGRAGVRFSQRPARHREFDRDHRVHAHAAAALCGDVGGVLQLHRVPVVRRARGADDRRRHRVRRRDGCARDLRRADGRHLLESHHLVGAAFRPRARMR